jgi:hypothetical protein
MQSIRKRFSLLRVISLAAIAALSLAVGVTEVQAETTLVLNVDVDEDSFVLNNFPGAFNIVGDTGSGEGTFQCWGWINADESANVSQSFNVEDRGAIMTQGPEGGLLAIVGGTGDFKNARGEARQVFNNDGTFDFTMTFRFTGQGRRR